MVDSRNGPDRIDVGDALFYLYYALRWVITKNFKFTYLKHLHCKLQSPASLGILQARRILGAVAAERDILVPHIIPYPKPSFGANIIMEHRGISYKSSFQTQPGI